MAQATIVKAYLKYVYHSVHISFPNMRPPENSNRSDHFFAATARAGCRSPPSAGAVFEAILEPPRPSTAEQVNRAVRTGLPKSPG